MKTELEWKNQSDACRLSLALIKDSDWNAADSVTSKACKEFPDSIGLIGARMNTLFHLSRVEESVEEGIHFIHSCPDADKIVRNILAMLPKLPGIKIEWLSTLEKLSSECGRVLYVLALVKARRGVDSEFAFSNLHAAYPSQKTLPAFDFATHLAAVDLYENAERILQNADLSHLLDPSGVKSLVELLLKLALKDQPEKFGEAKQLAEAFYKANPDSPEAWYAMGRVWWDASRMDLSLPFLRRFVEVFPSHPIRPGVTFNSIYDESLNPDELFEIHTSWANTLMSSLPKDLPDVTTSFDPDRKLRVGYVSSDFGTHPVGFFSISTIPAYNPELYEVFIYSQRDPVTQDDSISKEFRASVGEDHWCWTCKLSDEELYNRVREDKIDILVDLAGHTTGNRMKVFAMRPAPIQVGWLGYPHSTGMPTIDYRISDSIIEPEGEVEQWSAEKIIRLPHGFHAIRMAKNLPEPSPPPCLKNGYLTFGSFNNVNKMGTYTIEMWASVLLEIPDSRLLLKHRTLNVFENREGIRSLFAFFGVDPTRISFAGTTPVHAEHFAMYEKMDIALDPLGYNGTTTTCEALYMGVPVLTLPGDKHASRVSASLLHRVGLNGWVAKDKEQYLKIARYASRNFDVLTRRRARLRQDFLNSPLNDGQALARELEKSYRQMWHRVCEQSQSRIPIH